MKNRNSNPAFDLPDILKSPAFGWPGYELFNELHRLLEKEIGYHLTYEALSEITGQSLSTVHHWFNISGQPHAKSLLALLERLSPELRHRFIDDFCRQFPTIRHPRLAHDEPTVRDITRLLSASRGLTVVHGGDAEGRAFVTAAFGHSFPFVDKSHRCAAGLVLHPEKSHVPVEVYIYPGPSVSSHEQLLSFTKQVWPSVRGATTPLLCLEGIWSTAPQLQKEILQIAHKQHIILVEHQLSVPLAFRTGRKTPFRIATISRLTGLHCRLRVVME